ncbi:hypothetical protein EDB19DRAFT_1740359 [Suillus lakei]|nr:hypothetical protein EDB19DRAFT_1740359 [Suillus lakei]
MCNVFLIFLIFLPCTSYVFCDSPCVSHHLLYSSFIVSPSVKVGLIETLGPVYDRLVWVQSGGVPAARLDSSVV